MFSSLNEFEFFPGILTDDDLLCQIMCASRERSFKNVSTINAWSNVSNFETERLSISLQNGYFQYYIFKSY